MCGIIAAFLRTPSAEDLYLVKHVFVESRIRGMHATGMSYIKNGQLVTIKKPVPADRFFEGIAVSDLVNEDGNLYLIGHCRYSTSDLEYNQPLVGADVSIVHNGVITQELPEHWEDLYGFKTETKNDSELVLRTIEADEEPLTHWPEASVAACELYIDKTLRFYRNGQRPIHYVNLSNGYIVASTRDVFRRTGINEVLDGNMNVVYTVNSDFELDESYIPTNAKDLQNENIDYRQSLSA